MKDMPRGFTLVELVMVMVLLGILSFYAVPRFMDVLDFERAGFYQEVVSATRYAHRLAVGRGDKVRIKFREHGYTLYYQNPAGKYEILSASHPVYKNTESGITLQENYNPLDDPLNATFSALGNCEDCNGDLTITIGGKEMTIFQKTGYVNASS